MLVDHHEDSFMLAKLHFFKYIVSTFRPLLISLQTDNPMIPFLSDTNEEILRRLMQKLWKKHIQLIGFTRLILQIKRFLYLQNRSTLVQQHRILLSRITCLPTRNFNLEKVVLKCLYLSLKSFKKEIL